MTPDSSKVAKGGELSQPQNSQQTSQDTGQFARRGNGRPKNHALLWTVDSTGKVSAIPVVKGVTDGKTTEITSMHGELTEGMQVITKLPQQKTSSARNPLMPQGPPGPGMRR